VGFAILVIVAMGGFAAVSIGWLKEDRLAIRTHLTLNSSATATATPIPATSAELTVPNAAEVDGTRSTTNVSGTEPSTNPIALLQVVPSGSYSALVVLQSIPVNNEQQDGYDRGLFGGWSDLDGDGCDTRAEVLMDESLSAPQVDPFGCFVVVGDWLSSYDGQVVGDPAELDIDHVVALKEAWESGAWSWSPERRMAYANDLSDDRTLAAVTSRSNESKGENDPSTWLPVPSALCQYVADWVSIKARWGMSMDDSEWRRVEQLLQGECVGAAIKGWAAAPG
jgi:hypothetical protein